MTCLRCSAAPKITDSAALERSLTAIEAFDQFAMQGLPRWVTNDAATQKAYDALVEKVCPCVVVVHSQGGSFGFNAAVTAPDKIKALVAIEPSGALDSANVDVGKLKGVPHLIVWGDFRDKVAVWQRLPIAPTRYRDALVAAGGKADNFDLPAIGKDNTHMLMMDRNSDERRQADPRLDRQAGTGELTPAPARILSNLHCGRGDRDPTWGTAWKSSTLAVQAGLFGRINRTTGLHQSDRSCRQDHLSFGYGAICLKTCKTIYSGRR